MRKFLLLPLLLLLGCAPKAVREYKAVAVKEYPHDTTSYTQGLFFDGDTFFETTGQWGESTIRKVELESGKTLSRVDFPEEYFLEGSVALCGVLYVLTWTNRQILKYDASTLKPIGALRYPREGWGLTSDGKRFYASDGSSRIYVTGPDFKAEKTIRVTMDGHPVRYLNELEWIDGRIWANVYTSDTIVIINPRSGVVEARVDCSGLYPRAGRSPHADVLNGIAVSPDGRIFLTGKYWPKLFEVVIEE